MGVTLDHVGVPAADPEGAARFLADPLGGTGRIYFVDPDSHVFELILPAS